MARGEPKSLQTLLPRALGRLAADSKSAVALGPVWKAVAGEAIARSARPVRLDDRVLTLEVASKNWARELEARSAELLELLNAALGGQRIGRLVFEVKRP